MGLAPMGNWFNFATDLVTNRIKKLDKSVDHVLAAYESAEQLEETMDTFFARCKEPGVTLNQKKFICSTIIKYVYTRRRLGGTTGSEKAGEVASIPKPTESSGHKISDRNNPDQMVAFDLEKRIQILTDTVTTGGMGCALCQPNDQVDLRLVSCGSTGLKDTQRHYAMVELKLVSITNALENSIFFCLGAREIIMHSDDQALEEPQQKGYDQINNKMLVGLFEHICHYNVRIKYVAGAKNELTEKFLRNPPDTAEVSDILNMIQYKVQYLCHMVPADFPDDE